MGKLIWIVIGLIVYFGGGWIAKDIVFSMIEITNKTTLGDLTSYEFITYSVVAGVVSLIATLYEDNEIGYISLIAIGITCGIVREMPLSMGLIVLYNIINVGGIIVSHLQTPYCPHEILSAPLRGIKSIAYDIHDN